MTDPLRGGIEATFESRCPACDERIYEGDLIDQNEDGEWVHARCVDE